MNYDLKFNEENGWAAIKKMKTNKEHKAVMADIYRDNFSGGNVLGSCVDLYRQLRPETVQDFKNKLDAFSEEHQDLPINDRGPTTSELLESAKAFRQKCGERNADLLSYDDLFYYHILQHHQITETFYGETREEGLCDFLEKQGLNVREATRYEDKHCCVDIFIADENNNDIGAIQIKPISFVLGMGVDLIRDRNKLIPAMELLKKKKNLNLNFVVYNERNQWLKNKRNGKISFRFNDLFEFDANNNVVVNKNYKYSQQREWQKLEIN